MAGSSSCGVEATSSGYTGGLPGVAEHAYVAGRGVFIEDLLAELERRGVPFPAEEMGASLAVIDLHIILG